MPCVKEVDQAVAGLIWAVSHALDLSELHEQVTQLLMCDAWSYSEQGNDACRDTL